MTQQICRVIDVAGRGVVLTHYQHGSVHPIHQRLGVGEVTHGGRIQNDIVKNTELIEQRVHGLAGEQFGAAAIRLCGEQHIQAKLLVAHHALQQVFLGKG